MPSSPPAGLARSLDRPIIAAVLTAILYALFLVARLTVQGFDASTFVLAGDRFCDASQTPYGLYIWRGSDGYDGQFYYRLALDPFTVQKSDHGITFDAPAYRQQRILYPAVAMLLSLGASSAIPIALIGINYAAIVAIAWLSSSLCRSYGVSGCWGMLPTLYPGFVLTLSRDLTELLAISLVLAGLLLFRRERPVWAGLTFALAGLARETTLLVAIVAGAASLIAYYREERRLDGTALGLALPFTVQAFWQIRLFMTWGRLPVQEGGGNIGLPLAGLAERLGTLATMPLHLQIIWLGEVAFVVALALAAGISVRASKVDPIVRASWLLYLALALTLTPIVWVNDWAFFRALSELGVLSALIVACRGSRVRSFSAASIVVAWLGLALLGALVYDNANLASWLGRGPVG